MCEEHRDRTGGWNGHAVHGGLVCSQNVIDPDTISGLPARRFSTPNSCSQRPGAAEVLSPCLCCQATTGPGDHALPRKRSRRSASGPRCDRNARVDGTHPPAPADARATAGTPDSHSGKRATEYDPPARNSRHANRHRSRAIVGAGTCLPGGQPAGGPVTHRRKRMRRRMRHEGPCVRSEAVAVATPQEAPWDASSVTCLQSWPGSSPAAWSTWACSTWVPAWCRLRLAPTSPPSKASRRRCRCSSRGTSCSRSQRTRWARSQARSWPPCWRPGAAPSRPGGGCAVPVWRRRQRISAVRADVVQRRRRGVRLRAGGVVGTAAGAAAWGGWANGCLSSGFRSPRGRLPGHRCTCSVRRAPVRRLRLAGESAPHPSNIWSVPARRPAWVR